MKLWLDSTDLELIKRGVKVGILHGVTTNPKILADNPLSLEDALDQLLSEQEGPITVQVIADTAEEMTRQGQRLYYYSNRIIIKIPASEAGYSAIHRLSRHSIPTMATGVFTSEQALIAAEAGADYVAPYLSRIAKLGIDPISTVLSMRRMFKAELYHTEILAASLSSLDQLAPLAEAGIEGVTLKPPLFEALIGNNPHTEEVMQEFNQYWLERKPPLSAAFV